MILISQIKQTETNRQTGYEVRFPYDPSLVDIIKEVPGRRWNPTDKTWILPNDKVGWFIDRLNHSIYASQYKIESDEQFNEDKKMEQTTDIPNIELKYQMMVKEGSTPFQHQIDFMKFAVDRFNHKKFSGFICADEQGLGKTLEAFNLAIYAKKRYGLKRCLVLCCVNSSKYNWVNDITEHSRGEYIPYIIGSRKLRNGTIKCKGSAEKLEDLTNLTMYGEEEPLPYFIILNVESLHYSVGKHYPIADAIIELINKNEIDMVVIDEVHKGLSPSAIQGKQLLRIKKATAKNPVFWLPMSGTPIVNRPTDLFLSLRLVDGHYYDSFFKFAQTYCVYGGFGGHQIVGFKNIDGLKETFQNNSIRRLKSTVLDLPPKIYYDEYVENTPYQSRLYEKITLDMISEQDDIIQSLNPLAKFLRLRQANGNPELVDMSISADDKDYLKKNAKLVRLLELLEDIHERNEKVVIFSNWVESIKTLYKYISKKYNTCLFTGSMTVEEREKSKKLFQNNPKYTVILGTIGALGTTHTLTASSNVIFYDEPWTPSDKAQAECRSYRIGTKTSVSIYTLLSKDTIDDRVHNLLYKKQGMSNYIVDNMDSAIRNNPDLLRLLLQ